MGLRPTPWPAPSVSVRTPSGRRSTSSPSTSTQSRFARVRDAGGLILSAANATELNTTLDTLLSDKILVEK